MLRYSGKAPKTGWDIFTAYARDSDLVPAALELPAPNFVCLLDWDVGAASDAQVDALAQRLLVAGAVMVCCRGEDSGRVCERFAAVMAGRDGVVHLKKTVVALPGTVQDAVSFLTNEACPAPRYLAQCSTILAVVISPTIYRFAQVELAIATHLLQAM